MYQLIMTTVDMNLKQIIEQLNKHQLMPLNIKQLNNMGLQMQKYISNGGNVDAFINGVPMFHFVCYNYSFHNIMKEELIMFLRYNANIHIIDKYGNTPLSILLQNKISVFGNVFSRC